MNKTPDSSLQPQPPCKLPFFFKYIFYFILSGLINARAQFDMTYSNIILKYSLRVIFNYREVKHKWPRVMRSIMWAARVRQSWLIDGQRPSLVTLEIIVSI